VNQYQQPLAGLASDTALRETPEGFEATLNPDWETIGPCGGYLAAIALRAAGQRTGRPRPVSISCTFLRRGTSGPVGVCVQTLTETRRAASVEVSVTQDAKPLMKALVWLVSGGLPGPAHDAAPMPSVTPPEELPELDTVLPPGYTRPFASWRNGLEERTLTYDFGECRRPFGEPRILSWFRFRPVAAFDDPFVDGGRFLLLIDTMPFPAASAAYEEIPPYFAQSLDLTVHFHRAVPGQEWMLCEATSPVAGDGIMSGRTRIWGRDGALLASGSQQLILSKFPTKISNPLSGTDRRSSLQASAALQGDGLIAADVLHQPAECGRQVTHPERVEPVRRVPDHDVQAVLSGRAQQELEVEPVRHPIGRSHWRDLEPVDREAERFPGQQLEDDVVGAPGQPGEQVRGQQLTRKLLMAQRVQRRPGGFPDQIVEGIRTGEGRPQQHHVGKETDGGAGLGVTAVRHQGGDGQVALPGHAVQRDVERGQQQHERRCL
jgi:acyl-CoA thioesterase